MDAEIENSTSAMELAYMRRVKFQLNIIGSWPEDRNGTEDHDIRRSKRLSRVELKSTVLFVTWLLLLSSIVAYLWNHKHILTFFELGQIYNSLFVYLHNTLCFTMLWFKKYGEVMHEFTHEMHLHYVQSKSKNCNAVKKQIHKLCSIMTTSVLCQMYFGVVLFNMAPFYNNYSSGIFASIGNRTFEHAVAYQLPVPTNNYIGYFCLFALNWIIVWACTISFCTFSLLLCLIMLHVYGHLEILKGNLEDFPKVSGSVVGWWYTREQRDIFMKQLIDNIVHHRRIMTFMDKMSCVFGRVVCAYYAFHLFSGCILLLECSELDTMIISKYGPITVVLIQQLVQISVIFELVFSKSVCLIDTVYNLPWECLDAADRKMVLFLLRVVQRPIKFKALGVVPVGVRTMYTIMKTCISYFLILRTAATAK